MGLPDEAFTISENIEVSKNEFYENGMPSIVVFNPPIEDNIEYTGEHEYWAGRIGSDPADEHISKEDAFVLPSDIIFSVKERMPFDSATTKDGEFIFGDEQIMGNLMTIDEGTEACRSKAKELGAEEYLYELNSKYIKDPE